MNTITIDGNLTRDPEVKFMNSGKAVVKFAIANSKRFQKDGQWQERPRFFDCEYWTEKPDYWTAQLIKGKGVVICGELDQETWDSEGGKRSRVKIVLSEPPVIKSRGIPKDGQQSGGQQSDEKFDDDPDIDTIPF